MTTILSFCGTCGVVLPVGVGKLKDPRCANCGDSVKERSRRIEGSFADGEAGRLTDIWDAFEPEEES